MPVTPPGAGSAYRADGPRRCYDFKKLPDRQPLRRGVMVVPQRRKPESTPLTMSIDDSDSAAPLIRIAGDLDFTTAAPLRTALDHLLTSRPPAIVLDFGGLLFIDSTGLAVIVHAWRVGHQQGTVIRLRDTPRFLDTILDITGVNGLLARPPRAERQDRPAATA
jgi:stage II sporulation protein AA (anti-sigma F factor antagonist)